MLCAIAAGVGCSQGEFHHPVYPAGGTVTRGGEPVVDALVSFHPVDPATVAIPEGREGPPVAFPTAHTGDQGQFSLSTYLAGDGVPAGTYKVTVSFLGGSPEGAEVSESGDETGIEEGGPRFVPARPERQIAPQYASPETTPLEATVSPDAENQFAFEIE